MVRIQGLLYLRMLSKEDLQSVKQGIMKDIERGVIVIGDEADVVFIQGSPDIAFEEEEVIE